MSTLYELSDQFQSICNILESLEDEQIPVELQREVENILQQKDETQAELYQKIDNYISLIKHLEMFAEMREKEAKRMAELAKRDRKKIDFLKKQLLNHFESTGQSKVKTSKHSIGVRKASQAPLRLKGSVEALPDEFKKVLIEPDKKALRDAIKSEVEGIEQYAELGEKSSYLSIR
ncbi:MAG: siphovirus Gp157 family protein [Microcoleaceae cyanobacterium]